MHDVAILGGGLAGSSLATVLSRQGWDVVVIEQRHLPQHKVCGEFLSPESQASFAHMGLSAAIARLSPATMERALLTTPTGVALQVELPGQALGVSRFALDAALLEAAAQAGATVYTGTTASGVQLDAQGCSIETHAGPQRAIIRARTAIAACGRQPPAGLRPRNESAPARQRHVGLKWHFENLDMLPQVELYLFPGGYAGLSPVEQGRANLCLLATQERFRYAGGSLPAMLEAICHWNPALRHRLAGGAVIPGSQKAVAAVDTARPATPWQEIAQVGDAVTMIPPLCGDGMAMALRSAELCAPLAHAYLEGHISRATWQQHYIRRWHQEFDRALLVGRSLQACLIQPGIADLTLLLGKGIPALARQAVRLTRGSMQPNRASLQA